MLHWKEIAPGHHVSDTGLHVVDGKAKDPCAACKGTGKRGRGRCGKCLGNGVVRHKYDIPFVNGFLQHRMGWWDLATAKGLAEIDGDPSEVIEYSPDGQYDHDLLEIRRRMAS